MSDYGRATTLLALMHELGEVMRAEVAVVGAMKLDRLAALQAEKSALAEAYERELRAFRADPATVVALDPGIRGRLREATLEFQAAASANARRLEAARTVVEGVMQALGEAASRATTGRYPGGTPSRGGQVIPLALSRQV